LQIDRQQVNSKRSEIDKQHIAQRIDDLAIQRLRWLHAQARQKALHVKAR